ncbi:MAG TPA: hypothetical protein VK804_16275 [Bradyrhizobium sp.]|jgi:hypothetical protein|uniref:hypothetical protein n=1 Tax=Bradyrhizobium sp. TaxID=376 RepID=UPI002C66BF73|nr:hypothetical protein [Bradyrhizobium sp.]HTB02025.1 hypothetical protein [Bradyrhizobium sp.]
MLNERDRGPGSKSGHPLSRLAHVVGRIGLSMSGAMGGTFVAAYLAKANIDPFDSIGFIAAMILVGIAGFYLGIDIPRPGTTRIGAAARVGLPGVDGIELLSATGTFLAALAALASVYAIVFDAPPLGAWELLIGSWWLAGIMMQIGAGSLGRLGLARIAG